LLHDLGKGATPPEQWPRHIGHEERGLVLIEALCQRLRAPNDYRELALLTGKYHLVIHRAEELRPATLLDILQSLDAFRRPERFEQFLLACEADFSGRPGYEQQSYTQAAFLRRMLQIALRVDAAALAAQGLNGKALAAELRQRRIAAIRAARGKRDAGPDEPD
jgi:tRNA nucleotidyltransferase (CCA-adding enzyme)